MLRRWVALLIVSPLLAQDPYELNESFDTAKAVPLERDVTAQVSPVGDRDFYSIDLDAPGVLRFVLDRCPKEVHPALSVLSATDVEVGRFDPLNQRRQGTNLVREFELSKPGRYVILFHDGKGWDGDAEDNAASEEAYRFRLEFSAASDTSEPNDAQDSATALDPGKAVRARLFPTGDVDWYRVDPPAPGIGLLSLRVSRVPENVNPKLTVLCPGDRTFVFDPKHQRKTGHDLSWCVETLGPGPVYVRFEDGAGWDGDPEGNASSTDEYTVETSFVASPDAGANAGPGSAAALVPGSPADGALFPTGAFRWYRVPAASAGRLTVSLTGLADSVAPEIALLRLKEGAAIQGLDETEWRKRFDDWCLDPKPEKDLSPFQAVGVYFPYYQHTEGKPACLCVDLDRPGDCWLVLRDGRSWDSDVLDNQGGVATYRLWIELAGVSDPYEPCDTPETAKPLPLDQPFPVTLFPEGDTDVFALTLERSAQIDVALTGIPSTLVPLLKLTDAQGVEVPLPQTGDANPTVLSVGVAKAGKYFLSFQDRNRRASKDAFTVLVHLEATLVEEPEGEEARPLEAGKAVDAQLFPDKDVDLYAVDAPGPGVIRVLVTDLPGTSWTPVQILDADGQTVLLQAGPVAPSAPLAGRHAALCWEMRSQGRCLVRVGNAEAGARSASVHPYRIRYEFDAVALTEVGSNDTVEKATPLADGTPAEDLLFPRTDVDWYAIDAPEGASIAVLFENPGGLATEIRLSPASEPDKELSKTTAWLNVDGYLQADALPAGRYLIRVQDASSSPEEKRASARPYRLIAKTVAQGAWAEVSAPEKEKARDLALGTWQAIRFPKGEDSIWFRVPVASAGSLRVLAAPAGEVAMRGDLHGVDGAWSRVSSSRSYVSLPTATVGAGDVYLCVSHWAEGEEPPAALVYADVVPAPASAAASFATPGASVGPLAASEETWIAADAAGPGRVRIVLEGFTETRQIGCDVYFGPQDADAVEKLRLIGERLQPTPMNLSGGTQVLEVPVPSEGRLRVRVRSESGLPFAVRASSEFIAAKPLGARELELVPGTMLPIDFTAEAPSMRLRTTLEGGQAAAIVMFNRSWGIQARVTIHEELAAGERPRVLLLTRRNDGSIERRFPGIDFTRVTPWDRDVDPLADLTPYRAVLCAELAGLDEFGLDKPERRQLLEAFAEKGGRVVLATSIWNGAHWGGTLQSGWSSDPVSATADFAKLLPGIGDVGPERGYHATGTITLDAAEGFTPLLAMASDPAKVVIAAKSIGQGAVFLDLQPAPTDDTPVVWDEKLCAELGVPYTHRWVGRWQGTCSWRGEGAELIGLEPKAKTSYVVRIDSLDDRSEGGRVVVTLLTRTLSTPLEPNDDFAQATQLRSGEPARANLSTQGDRDFFELRTPSRGIVNVSVLNVPEGLDVFVDGYLVPAGSKGVKASPRILYLVGGRKDYNLHTRFPDLAMTRVEHDAAEAATWLDRVGQFDVVIADGVNGAMQFGLGRAETITRIEEWVRAGGRFVLICPQGVTRSLIAAQNGGSVVSFSSQWDTGRWRAQNAIDGITGVGNPSGWCCGNGAAFPHEIVFSFRDKEPREFDRIVLHANCQGPDTRMREFEVFACSGDDPAAGPWESLGKHEARPEDVAQVFPVTRRSARFVKLVVTSNYGHAVETQLGEFAILDGEDAGPFGLRQEGWWTDEAIARAPEAEALFPQVSRGPVNGWSASDANGWWVGWKEAGFAPLFVYPGDPQGRAATVYRRLGKGTILLDTQEIGYPGNVQGNWKVYELLEFPMQIQPLVTWNGTQNLAGRGSESFDVIVPGGGSLVFVVRDAYGRPASEEYAVTARFRAVPAPFEPNDAPPQAATLPLGKPVPTGIQSNGDIDWFAFHLPTEGMLHWRLSDLSPYVNPRVRLFHASKLDQPVAEWVWTQRHTTREEAMQFHVVRPGTWYLSIHEEGNDWSSATPATLEVSFDPSPAFEEPNETPESARPLQLGLQTVSFGPVGDADWFSFEATGPGDLLLDLLGPIQWQNPVVQVFKADKPTEQLAFLNVEGDGGSESFRWAIPEAGRYLLQVSDNDHNQPSPRRIRMRAEWPGEAAGAARLVRTSPEDQATRVDPSSAILLLFDALPGDLAGKVSIEGSVSGRIAIRLESVPGEPAVRVVPEKLAPEETVTVRVEAGDPRVFVFTTSAPAEEAPQVTGALRVLLPKGRTLGIGKHAVSVQSTVELAEAPTLRFTAKGGRPVDAGGFSSDDGLTWTGQMEVAQGMTEGMAVFEASARTATGDEVRRIDEATRSFLIDATPPQAPGALTARPGPYGVVDLAWQAPSGETVARYVVYRNGERLSEAERAASRDIPEMDGEYRYAVSALDAAGNEGLRSPEVPAVSDRVPPAEAPVDLAAAVVEGRKVALSWKPVEGARYAVYRSAAAIDETTRKNLRPVVEKVEQPGHVDVPGDGTWFYAVCAADPAGNLGPVSACATVPLDSTGPVATITVEGTQPFGPGSYPVRMEVSEPLREAPILSIVPRRRDAVPLALKTVDETHFVGVLEVKTGFGEGFAEFKVECNDKNGNPCRGLQHEHVGVVIDTQGPTVQVRRKGFSRLAAGANDVLFEADEPLSKLSARVTIAGADPVEVALSPRAEDLFAATIEVPAGTRGGKAVISLSTEDSSGHTAEAEATLVVDGLAPSAPADVVASPSGEKAVLVKWTAIPEEVSGYRVYRATSEDGLPAGRIADALKETRLADPVTQERVYFYAVSAVDLAGNESPLSRPVRVLADVTASGPPELSAPSVDPSVTVRLLWKPPSGADNVTYRVYRDSAEFQDRLGRAPIATGLTTTSASDVPVLSGTYFYAVSAVDPSGNESRLSAALPIAFAQNRPTAAIHLEPPSPIRANVRIQLTTLKPLKAAPQFSVTLRDGRVIDLPVQGAGATWESSLAVTNDLPNGEARFRYFGTSTEGVSTELISEGALFVVDTAAPVVELWLQPEGRVRPGPLTVRVVPSEPLAGAPQLGVVLPGQAPAAVGLAPHPDLPGQFLGQVTVPEGAKDGVAVFRVEATDLAGNVGKAIGRNEQFDVDTTPPRAPQGLAATPQREGRIALTWAPPAYGASEIPEALAGYNVYRSNQPIADVKALVPVSLNVRQGEHADTTPTDGEWHYVVTCVDRAGLEGPPSNAVSATSDRVPPAAPKITAAGLSASKTRMEVSWEAADAEAQVVFRVYRSPRPIEKLEGLVPVWEGAEHRVEDIPRETGRLYYAIAAVDALGHVSAPSAAYPVEYAPVAASAHVRMPSLRLTRGKHAVTLETTRALVEAPSLSVTLPGTDAPIAIALAGSGTTWRGEVTIEDGTPEGKARFAYVGKVQEGAEVVPGDVIASGEVFDVDGTAPTARIVFDDPLGRRDQAVAMREGTYGFTLECPEELAAAPTLSFLPRTGDPRPIALEASGSGRWRGAVQIDKNVVEGTATLDFLAKDLAGNEGNRVLAGKYLEVDRTPPEALDPVQAVFFPGGQVRLGWNRPPVPGDTRFQVFRSNQKIEDLSALTPIADHGFILSFVDRPEEDGTYYYVVRVIDDAGNIGKPSEVQQVRCDKSPPQPPTGLAVEEDGGVIHVTWKSPEGEKPFIYNAYISDHPVTSTVGAKSMSANIPGSFTEIYGAPEENGTYYLALTAVDEANNESAPSESVKFEYRRFAALSRIHIVQLVASGMETKGLDALARKERDERLNRVRVGRYEVRLETNKLLAEPPTLSFVPEGGEPITVPMSGGGTAWRGAMEIGEDLPQGATYFQVSTKDTDGNVGKDILEGEYFVIDTTPPGAPPSLKVEARTEEAAGTIRLTWRTPEGEVPHFYRVYRSETPIRQFTEAVQVGLVKVVYENEAEYLYDDFPPKDATYYYRVTGLDLAGNESGPTECLSADCSTKAPRASIRVFTAASGDVPAEVIGPGKVRVELSTSRSLSAAPTVSFAGVPVRMGGSESVWTGEFEVPASIEDGEVEFTWTGKAVDGTAGSFIAQGKTWRLDRVAPMAEVLIPRIAQLQVQLSWDGSEKHKLDTPPLGVGVHDVEVSIYRTMMDDERMARWAQNDPGDPKELVGPPELSFETADGKNFPIPLRGFGARWSGRIEIRPEMANGKAVLRFAGEDRSGNPTKKLAPLRRWHVLDPDDMSDTPRVIANYATTGGRFMIDTVPPGAPRMKDLVVRKLGVVEIPWEKPEGEAPATYRSYRSLFPITQENRGTCINDKVMAPVWVDAPPHDGNWYYAATAVDLSGNEGPISDSKHIFVDSIKPELKITPVPLDDEFVIIEVESDQPILSLDLKFPGSARVEAILGGESGQLEKKEGGGYTYRKKLPLAQLQEVFNGKVEVIVYSPDPVGNVVSSSAPISAQAISSATGGSVESGDGLVQLVIPPGVRPTVPKGPKEQRVTGKDDVYFVSYAYIPSKPKLRIELPVTGTALAKLLDVPDQVIEAALSSARPGSTMDEPVPEDLVRELCAIFQKEVELLAPGTAEEDARHRRVTDVESLPPGLEVIGKPYVVQINRPPEEPLEMKASATQADLSGLQNIPKLMMKIPEDLADQYSDPEFMARKLKVLSWNPAPDGDKKKARWEVVDKVQMDPVTKEIIVPADKVTTYVIVSERTPPTITELSPSEGSSLAEPIKEVTCRVLDKGTGVATGAENRVVVEFDGRSVDPAFVTLGEGDPTEVPVTARIAEWLAQARPETKGQIAPGPHRVRVYAQDIVENVATRTWEFHYDDRPPEIRAVYPSEGAIVACARPAVTAMLIDNAGIDPSSIDVRIDDEPLAQDEVSFDEASGLVAGLRRRPLSSGKHRLVVAVNDNCGKPARPYEGTFLVDTEGPRVVASSPAPDGWVREGEVRLSCALVDVPSGVDLSPEAPPGGAKGEPSGISVMLDGARVEAAYDATAQTLSGVLDVKDGEHRIEVQARDRAGNIATRGWRFRVDRHAPIFFDLGAKARVALRLADFGSGLAAETLVVTEAGEWTWDPDSGVLLAERTPQAAIADRAGNLSKFASPGVPISEYDKLLSGGRPPKIEPPQPPKVEETPPTPPTPAPAAPAGTEGGSAWPWVLGVVLALGAGGASGWWYLRKRGKGVHRP